MNLSNRFAYKAEACQFIQTSEDEVLGQLINQHKFRQLEQQQINAWLRQIKDLKQVLAGFPGVTLLLEFEIPRIGRRVDAILILNGAILVMEYKVGAKSYDSTSIDQAYDYALDLKNFHKASHNLNIVPILIATDAPNKSPKLEIGADGIATPILANSENLLSILSFVSNSLPKSVLDAESWISSAYHPTPTIVEAAQALYKGHKVEEISRSDAGAINLTKTCAQVSRVIDDAKANNKKVICLITGAPGAGKSLAGLNIAIERMHYLENEHAVFLSGNGPLVAVLREALVQDQLAENDSLPKDERIKRKPAEQKASAFIQNIHHFRDDNLASNEPPIEKVVIFDEAQRAWNEEQASSFMKRKRGQDNFSMSEPDFLLSVMNRHKDWCVVVCLIGGGQEINTGEGGIIEWISALKESYKDWEIHFSNEIFKSDYALSREWLEDQGPLKLHLEPDLNLSVSLRSFRAEKLSAFVSAVISGDSIKAREIKGHLTRYPIYLTRNLEVARSALRGWARGSERIGLVASSNAIRLKPSGIFVKGEIDPIHWFLKGKTDIRSSHYLEDVATEFDIQGLEIDWVGVCWDANFRIEDGRWATYNFSGSKWQSVHDLEKQKYITNSYRVLLTRGRQGMVIFVPEGDDLDPTRQKSYYDQTYDFLKSCGMGEI
ncbi:DUF2075 domain-containing protein [Polynucleobacter sp. UK-Gri1-W3]|uniref:DUF2075 domain-containing protein n=1 Tax=Polynucleobacter sp. UK-Gri1-W3 TaxID=1819737 RepID=UPI001C0C0E21|nr:DUF2075 domain-containing protein [Polynucleobacter sp. UK-Gri1-W3]MBU3537653.1 DUF2075 domain-containing protein [Polynucleobacter sp. UK-Gri1-W3]